MRRSDDKRFWHGRRIARLAVARPDRSIVELTREGSRCPFLSELVQLLAHPAQKLIKRLHGHRVLFGVADFTVSELTPSSPVPRDIGQTEFPDHAADLWIGESVEIDD